MNIQTPHRSPRRTPKCPSHPQHPRSTVPNYTHLVMNQWVRSCKNQRHASLFSNLFGSPFQPKLLGLVLQVQGFNGHLMYSQSGWNRNIICPGFQITAIELQSISANKTCKTCFGGPKSYWNTPTKTWFMKNPSSSFLFPPTPPPPPLVVKDY